MINQVNTSGFLASYGGSSRSGNSSGPINVQQDSLDFFLRRKEDLVFCLFSEIKAAMSRHVLEGYDVTQPVVDRVLYLLGGMVRYGIEHPREFLLMDQLALVPFIHERAKSDVPALVAALKQVLIDATQQHLLKAMPPGVILALISGAMDALVEAHMRQQIHLDQATIEQAMLACWDAIKR
ncbi:MAG: hypothetical protein JO363_06575 [Solirubrobacterales bacterium]|nr:hypothetical protein [Solirubrobacterales bacterium]